MPKFEPRDVSVRGVGLFLAILAACMVVIGVLAWAGLRFLDHMAPNGRQPDTRSGQSAFTVLAPPRLQPNQTADLAQMRAHEEAVLQSYGWVDRPSGTIHIPIERAMQLTLQRKEAHP
jgi:hypothetical protein